MEIGLSIGSNLGDREENLSNARSLISTIKNIFISDFSSIYETEPIDVPEKFQKMPFLNAVIIAQADLPIPLFFREIKHIEKKMGRTDSFERNSPRIIDIDIIFAGEKSYNSPELVIPHPRWHTRRFVVEPLCELRPNLIVSGQKLTVKEILSSLPYNPTVVLFKKIW